jgi:hypothetical protein
MTPIPRKSGKPGISMELGSRPAQEKNQTTLPKPPRSQGIISKRTASAAVSAMAGTQRKRKGAASFQGSIPLASPATSCATGPMAKRTATIASSTARLLAVLPRA